MRPALEVINHLACITNDMEKTVRFYPDLLGMELFLGKGGRRLPPLYLSALVPTRSPSSSVATPNLGKSDRRPSASALTMCRLPSPTRRRCSASAIG